LSRPLPLRFTEGSPPSLYSLPREVAGPDHALPFIRNERAGVKAPPSAPYRGGADGALAIPSPSFEMVGQGSRPLPVLLAEGSERGTDSRGAGVPPYTPYRGRWMGPWPYPSPHSRWTGTVRGPSLYSVPREVGGALAIPFPAFGLEGHLLEGRGQGPDHTLPFIRNGRKGVKARPSTPYRRTWMGPWPHPSLHSEWKGRAKGVNGALTIPPPPSEWKDRPQGPSLDDFRGERMGL